MLTMNLNMNRDGICRLGFISEFSRDLLVSRCREMGKAILQDLGVDYHGACWMAVLVSRCRFGNLPTDLTRLKC